MLKAQPGNFETIAPLGIFSVHGYQTADPISAVLSARYFLPVIDRLRVNDLIVVCAAAAETQSMWRLFTVGGLKRQTEDAAVALNELAVAVPAGAAKGKAANPGAGKGAGKTGRT